MTPEEETILKRFETRTRQLILQYQELKQENELLRQRVDTLNRELENTKRDYSNLKVARMIDISDQDMKDAKGRLSKLIREIDKCIALLKI
ncbi:hypothetical protein [Bacteroides sp. OF04-15BH]|jgi:dynactin complex subunit|uniref:hypothetical protein n=1 Tax=Bacteroides sp. OF04-15BH TaxID=2292281 RepID=UPI000E510084|nr:hypothetical protein [Bacteroides sp. OF04-15BH]RHP66670.1 hypothetical protein DXA74_02235 [Bacteroides sp. OF04-15BH]